MKRVKLDMKVQKEKATILIVSTSGYRLAVASCKVIQSRAI